MQPEVSELLDSARVIYSAGYFMTVSPDTMLHAAKHACENDKLFCMVRLVPSFMILREVYCNLYAVSLLCVLV